MKLFNAMFSKVNGGLEQVFLNYTPTLTLQGNQVIPIIHPKSEISSLCPQEHLVTVHNYNQHDFFAIRRLRRLIDKHQPDCIITHSYRAAYLFKKTGRKVPKVAVCHVRSHYNFGTDAIIALTEHMRQEIIQSGIEAQRVYTVPNMVHLPAELSYKAPKDTEVPVIGACARLVFIKGIDVFIEALAELKRRSIAFKAKIAGDGKERGEYMRLIQQHQLEKDIDLLGWVENTDEFYKGLDIFCLPSREEAFGLVVLESMKHALPMVLTQLSGPLEIVGQSKSALFVPPEDPKKLADGLETLIRDKQLSKELSQRAFHRVQDYSSQKIGPLLHQVLGRIVTNYSTYATYERKM